jgi:hypothetical protein
VDRGAAGTENPQFAILVRCDALAMAGAFGGWRRGG